MYYKAVTAVRPLYYFFPRYGTSPCQFRNCNSAILYCVALKIHSSPTYLRVSERCTLVLVSFGEMHVLRNYAFLCITVFFFEIGLHWNTLFIFGRKIVVWFVCFVAIYFKFWFWLTFLIEALGELRKMLSCI